MMSKQMRRSGRLFKSVPILLIGSDAEGRMFSEDSRTVVLSLHGAGIVSNHKLLAEQELILRSKETNLEAEIRIVGEIGSEDGRHTYGVAFLDDDLDFWKMEFPAPPSQAERPLELVLACGSCGTTVSLLNGDYEFDVCAIHGGLVRYCTECGFATVWKRREAGGVPQTVAPEVGRRLEAPRREAVVVEHAGLESEEEESVVPPFASYVAPLEPVHLEPRTKRTELDVKEHRAKRLDERTESEARRGSESETRPNVATAVTTAVEDRRARVRAKVNYYACVQSVAFGKDVVMCIDMSRGGLGFKTKNAYAISTEVTIAVPFSLESPNAPAIYVPARVVNIAELPEQQMFRCGVAFLPVAGTRVHR
ncbi:MAG TPA: PilZ domain-containing protein [Candidatus Acidoferrum sp.]|nr:PilZ domain-containing protein [Candidatus Acidoferrum sp.]